MPGAHAEHAVPLADAMNVPTLHARAWLPYSVELEDDALRSDGIELEAPDPLLGTTLAAEPTPTDANVIAVPSAHKIPAGHGLQVLDPLKLALPVAHRRHSSAPRTLAKRPPGHGTQEVVPLPSPLLNCPGAHLVHDAAPAAEPNRPLSHGKHNGLSVFE